MSSMILAGKPYRTVIELLVSEHLGRPWTVRNARDMTEFACHPSAILSDGNYSVFAKYSDAVNGREQFEIEMAGLRLLSELAGVLTPTPVSIAPVASGSILVLEAVQAVKRYSRQWREIGHALARIHKIKGHRFGFETDGFFGPLYQDNTPASDWTTFYAERRLLPAFRLAVDSGHLPSVLIQQIETLIPRLPELCGPAVEPSLLHGDAQQNNFVSTDMGAVVIDPAVYYGHPEMDLAFVDYFQAVPNDVFDAYQDELPIEQGFWERRELWRIWGHLGAVTVEGPIHLGKLAGAVQTYV